jgi:hypothetical protein
MSRRFFLKTAAVWPIASAAAAAQQATPVAEVLAESVEPSLTQTSAEQAPAEPAVRSIELQRSAVAGFQYYQATQVWDLLRVGAQLTLQAEPSNAYDSRAVRVLWQGIQLGYVPRVDNAAICHLLSTGQTLDTKLISLQESSDPWDRLEFAVYLKVA